LVIGTDAGEVKVKLPRGDAVLYSSQSLHKIETITRGERNAAVTWIQSMVADPHQRQILYELDVATQMVAQDSPGTQQLRFLTKTYGNLVRLWAEV
jgi:PKHD-type hydroxylase